MLGSMIMVAAAAAPQAAEAAVAVPAPTGVEATRGVISYPPSFFAESKPTSAYDMVLRVPGFAFDKGTAVRGLAGSGGNVLIDGQTQATSDLLPLLYRALRLVQHRRERCDGTPQAGRTR